MHFTDLYVDTDNKWLRISNRKVLDELPEIIKNDSDDDDGLDERTSYLHSNIEKNERIIENKIHKSDSSPKYLRNNFEVTLEVIHELLTGGTRTEDLTLTKEYLNLECLGISPYSERRSRFQNFRGRNL